MTSEERILKPQESLALIAEAIRKTKENFRENGWFFLLWGWLIMVASLAFFLLHKYTSTRFFFLPFPVMAAVGIVTTLVWYRRLKATAAMESYVGYFLARLWLVVGIGFILGVFISLNRGWTPFFYTLLLGGIGTLVSGLAMKFNPLTWGGAVFFLAAVVGLFVPIDALPLLNAIAVIAGYLIPGYLLKASHE